MLCAELRNASAPAQPAPARRANPPRTWPLSPSTRSATPHRVSPCARSCRRHRHTARTTPTPTPPRPGAPRNPHPPPHTATLSACHRVWAYQQDAHSQCRQRSWRPDSAYASQRSRCLAPFMFGGRQRPHRPVRYPAPPAQPLTRRCEDIDHVAHQKVGCVPRIGNHAPGAWPDITASRRPTLRRANRPRCSTTSPSHPGLTKSGATAGDYR